MQKPIAQGGQLWRVASPSGMNAREDKTPAGCNPAEPTKNLRPQGPQQEHVREERNLAAKTQDRRPRTAAKR